MTDDGLIDLAKHRPPTVYTVDFWHHWDGKLEVFVRDIPDDERSRAALRWAFEQALKMFQDAESDGSSLKPLSTEKGMVE